MASNETLYIFDVSPFAYIGNHIHGTKKTTYGLPIGGIIHLNKYLAMALSEGSSVALCFDSKSFRKNVNKKYKSNRIPNPSVWAQLDVLYKMLTEAGFACYKKDGLEADDLIYNLVEENKYDYDEIKIYGTDYDLCCNVDDNVSFLSISSNVRDVDYDNFSDVMSKGDKLIDIPVNSLLPLKVFTRDSSDNISSFTSERGIKGIVIYNTFLKRCREAYGEDASLIFNSKPKLLSFINSLKGRHLTDNDVQNLIKRVELVYPVRIKEDALTGNFTKVSSLGRYGSGGNINIHTYAKFLMTTFDKISLKTLNIPMGGLSEEMGTYFKEKAKLLNTGAYAVDKDIPSDTFISNMESMVLGGFDD